MDSSSFSWLLYLRGAHAVGAPPHEDLWMLEMTCLCSSSRLLSLIPAVLNWPGLQANETK